MKYSELLQKLIGKEGSLSWGEPDWFSFNLNAPKHESNYKIVDVGSDYVILKSNTARVIIPLNLLVIRGDF